MKYKAVFLLHGSNTFFKIEMENHDQSANFVEADAKKLAPKLGADYMYLEEVKDGH